MRRWTLARNEGVLSARPLIVVASAVAGLFVAHCGGKPEVARGSEGTGGATSVEGGADSSSGGSQFLEDSGCQGCDASADASEGGEGDGAPAPYCGDGALNLQGEQCDDGNGAAGDGCSAACQLEANYVCPEPGRPCNSTEVCGDGRIVGNEQCDDKNTAASDGCSASCQLEAGYKCPLPGLRCIAAECGDGIVAGLEECDDGDSDPLDGCDGTCRLEDGFKCDTPGTDCVAISCGDAKAEGTEQCDDGNFDLGDGCTPYCKKEPDCTAGACVSACGDGIVLGTEACDDGNQRDGDGCSSTCTVELGFQCVQPALPDQIDIPLVVRDFAGLDPLPAVSGTPEDYAEPNHVDFEIVGGEPSGSLETGIVRSGQGSSATGRGLDLGQPGETFQIQHLDGSAVATVSVAGKPVYALTRTQCDKTALPSTTNAWDKCTSTTMDADSFHTWYVDRDSSGAAVTWPNFLGRGSTVLKRLSLLRGSFDAAGAFTAGGAGYTFDSRYMNIDGSIPTTAPSGFFPVDELGATGKTCGGESHDFHFTSEVRFWFEYDASASPPAHLDFSGDDDVWAYVNGHLALDIGGIHGRLADGFDVDATNAAAWGLEDGKVYEIAVFQAERNQCASNYWLTLQGFNTSKSQCRSTCGDGIVASDELCDDGPNNETQDPPSYGKCGPDCKTRGANCGDGNVDAGHEECDDGVNTSVYDFGGSGCAPRCVKPPRCGDSRIQSPYEECDDGTNDGSYGGCTADCKLGPRCGDGKKDPQEECDDGPAGSADCTTTCKNQVPS